MARVPVTIVTGALGAGKTTLVNHLIRTSGRRLAVIVNEFGDIGIDGDLIESGTEELIELSSGCVCCVVRGDLIRTLRSLTGARAFDGVLIETTGLANPGPVIQTFFTDQQLAARFRLDAVVTVVDALHVAGQLDASGDVADQIAMASVILLSKCDLAGDAGAIEARLRSLNPLAEVHRTLRGRVAHAALFGTRGFDLDPLGGLDAPEEVHAHGRGEPAALCFMSDAPVDAEALHGWLQALLSVHGQDILRTKGIFHVPGDERKLVVQGVHMLLEGDFIGRWPPGAPRVSRIVFIGRDLGRLKLEAGFRASLATVLA